NGRNPIESIVVEVCIVALLVLYSKALVCIFEQEAHVRAGSSHCRVLNHRDSAHLIVRVVCPITQRVKICEPHPSCEIVDKVGGHVCAGCEYPSSIGKVCMLIGRGVCGV